MNGEYLNKNVYKINLYYKIYYYLYFKISQYYLQFKISINLLFYYIKKIISFLKLNYTLIYMV